MDIRKFIEARVPAELLSSVETTTAIVIVRLSKQALPQIELYPGNLPFYHFGVRIGDHVYELIGHTLTQFDDGTSRYHLAQNLIESSFDSYKGLEYESIYLDDNCVPHILNRFHQIKDLETLTGDEFKTRLTQLNPDLKPYYDLMWCNCEHLATYLVTGVATCSQVDYVDQFVGTNIVMSDITKWIQTMIDMKIDAKYTNRAEAGFMKIVSDQFVKLIVSMIDKVVNKDNLLFARKTINTVIVDFSIPKTIYGPVTPIFGMLDQI